MNEVNGSGAGEPTIAEDWDYLESNPGDDVKNCVRSAGFQCILSIEKGLLNTWTFMARIQVQRKSLSSCLAWNPGVATI